MKREIIPAVLPESYNDLAEHVDAVASAVPLVQVDICDGLFVPRETWPFVGDSGEFEKITQGEAGLPFWETIDYEFDLMVESPKEHVAHYIALGAKRIILHCESKWVAETIDFLKKEYSYNAKDDMLELGMAIHLDTPLSAIAPYIDDVSVIQCMGIRRVGFQNQDFDEAVLEKIRDIKKMYPHIHVSVDGGVDIQNAETLLDAGADRLVAGHAIFESAEEPPLAVAAFNDILSTDASL